MRLLQHRIGVALVIGGLAGMADAATPPVIDRAGPPSWWPTAVEQHLTLLVEGRGLDGARVRFADGPVRVDRVEAMPGGRSLFVAATIPAQATPGRYRLLVETSGGTRERRWELVPRPARPANPVGPDDVIYLIMPDRFVNGDPSNDEADLVGEPMLDRRNPHAYHGGDFAGLRARLPYLADLGVTALWLTPIYRPAPRWYGPFPPRSDRYADFHGYSPVDFFDTNPRFGTREEYKSLVAEAHRLGLKVIQDQILGFTGPQHPWVQAPPTPGWFNGPLDHPPSCNFRFESATDPHAPREARRLLTDGWFLGILPDLDLRDDRAATYALQQSAWWAVLGEADGIRLDTYPMVDRSFWPRWSARVAEARPGLHAVGEAWMDDPSMVAFFQGGRVGWDGVDPGVASVFDFPLFNAIARVFSGQAPPSELGNALAHDHVYPHPESLTTLLDNHDTARLASVPGVTPDRLRLALAFLLTTRGTPQLTWGDEIGLPGGSNDRRDFPGGWPGDPRDAFTLAGRTPDERATFDSCRDLLRLRRATPALRRGNLTVLRADATVYLARRDHAGASAVVALNLGKSPATAAIPLDLADRLDPVYGRATRRGPELDLPPESASILRTR